ncbi:ABC transporter permease [Mesorhizobium sp. NPDC059054]|uniref:ABC transporter permease n=1 Tax=Mesorhizobium sp. NPDC059054 TaxID=3346711 RepID=UPI0036A1F505
MLDRPATETQITHFQRLWLYMLVALVFAFLIIPCLIVIPMSFSGSKYLEFPPRSWSLQWYEAYLGSSEWRAATFVSLRAALLTTIFATTFGTLAAYGISRAYGAASSLARGVFMLPMLVPLILVAIGCFLVYAKIGLNGTTTGLVMAHTVLALPFVVIAVLSGLASYDMNQERVAQSLGASRPWAFLTVTLPQIRLSVMSGALFAFVTSFDEVVIALFISGGQNATLTRLMFANIRDQIDPTVAAISSLLIGLSIVLLVGSHLLRGREDRK